MRGCRNSGRGPWSLQRQVAHIHCACTCSSRIGAIAIWTELTIKVRTSTCTTPHAWSRGHHKSGQAEQAKQRTLDWSSQPTWPHPGTRQHECAWSWAHHGLKKSAAMAHTRMGRSGSAMLRSMQELQRRLHTGLKSTKSWEQWSSRSRRSTTWAAAASTGVSGAEMVSGSTCEVAAATSTGHGSVQWQVKHMYCWHSGRWVQCTEQLHPSQAPHVPEAGTAALD